MIYSVLAAFLVSLFYVQCVLAQTWPSTPSLVASSGTQGHNGPSLTTYNGHLLVAYPTTSVGIQIFDSPDNGRTWDAWQTFLTNYVFNGGISLIVYKGDLYAISATSAGLCIVGTTNMMVWPTTCFIAIPGSFYSPSAAVFGNTVYVSLNTNQGYCIVSSTDMINWPSSCIYNSVSNVETKLFAGPTMLYLTYSLNSQLYMAFSPTPSDWVNYGDVGGANGAGEFLAPVAGSSAPALAFINNTQYVAIQGLDNYFYFSSSSDNGNSWTFPQRIFSPWQTPTPISMIASNENLIIGFNGLDKIPYFARSN